ncbi:MAG: hypothetical protein HYZ43_16680, partial [Flavobacteriia bacterium]|nr:hypothetical protein [Flavobacteriia bacterium]
NRTNSDRNRNSGEEDWANSSGAPTKAAIAADEEQTGQLLPSAALGVGSGDVDESFKTYYATHSTLLLPELQLRAHNQYMTSWISSGIFGFVGFLVWWILFLRAGWKKRSFIVVAFAGIALSSFLIEDTLETLMGVAFISLFYGLLVGNQKIWPTGKS